MKSQWFLLLITGVFSALSVAILIVSLVTQNWVQSEARYDDESITVRNSEINYGLYDGKLRRYYLQTERTHDLKIVCSFGINKCAFSCQPSDRRDDDFQRLLNDEALETCPESSAKVIHFSEPVNTAVQSKASAKYEKEFLSAGLWLSTVVFLYLTISLAAISALSSFSNIVCNPANDFFGPLGISCVNAVACASCLLTIIFWTSLYLIFINKNIGISDTLTIIGHYSSADLASLGFSFWILIASVFLHLSNIALVYYRNYLLQREPKPPAITVDKNDSTILVY